MVAKRKLVTPQEIDKLGLKVQSRLLACTYYAQARVLALYAPIRGEVATRDIMTAALADGKTVCYPLAHVHGRILAFRSIRSERDLEPGRLGVKEPSAESELVPIDQIELFVVPGLGFSRDGQRLGRGGGYYDATLRVASPKSRRVGIALSAQVLDSVPTNDDDIPMDVIVTENETIRGLNRGWEFVEV